MNNKLQMILIASVFAVPVLIATALQTPWLRYAPDETKNFGAVLSPSPLLTDWLPADPQRETKAGRWTLLFLSRDECDEACLQQIDTIQRVWQVQGTQRERLRLLYLATDEASLATLDKHWQTDTAVSELPLPEQARVVLVDPEGYGATWYAADFDGSELRKDVRHLLKWSKGGR